MATMMLIKEIFIYQYTNYYSSFNPYLIQMGGVLAKFQSKDIDYSTVHSRIQRGSGVVLLSRGEPPHARS